MPFQLTKGEMLFAMGYPLDSGNYQVGSFVAYNKCNISRVHLFHRYVCKEFLVLPHHIRV